MKEKEKDYDDGEFELVELTEVFTKLRVATRIISELYPSLLWKSQIFRRFARPERYQEIGNKIAEASLEIIRLQDMLGAIINEKENELYGE